MPLDLDQSGRIPQSHKTYLGPSVGWRITDEPSDIEWVINAGNNVIGAGFKGVLIIPSWLIVHDWVVMAAQVGSIVLDVYKTTLTQYLAGHIPQASDSITGTDKPTLTNGVCATSSLLTGWTTEIDQNDVLGFNVDSAAVVKQITLCLRCVRILGPQS